MQASRPDLGFEQAAAAPVAAITALQAVSEHGKVESGRKVLINGAAGGVGTFAVQIAKAQGAEVTGVCSTRNLDTIRKIGADRVVDYTREDFLDEGPPYHVMIDNVGNRSLSDCRRALVRDGIYVAVSAPKEGLWLGPMSRFVWIAVYFKFVSQKVASFTAAITRDRLQRLSELLTSGGVVPVVERTYALGEVPEAMRYMGTGHARGKLLIRL